MWPASWSSGQSFWLLIMKCRVLFPALPWGFFLEGKDSHGDHGLGIYTAERKPKKLNGLGSLVQLRLRPLLVLHIPPHRDNVTAPHGRPNLRSRLHCDQKILRFSWKPEVHRRVYNSLIVATLLRNITPINAMQFYLFNNHFNIILLRTPTSS
jgi:hypothetical protein